MKIESNWNEIFRDTSTVTIADFTIELEIPETCWNKWKELQKGPTKHYQKNF